MKKITENKKKEFKKIKIPSSAFLLKNTKEAI